jgi:Ca2+/Na+ antiporter
METDVRHLLDFGAVNADSSAHSTLTSIYAFLAGTLNARVTLFCVAVALCTLIALYVAAVVHRERSRADVQHAHPKPGAPF